ncbi:MAG: nucleotidyl transferase AbiEii/AbiGii toxin family protein [Planctomycetota bacterium]
MSFVHEDRDFGQLLAIVARQAGISEALVEKDYWVTHTLWALHETGLDIWFKGGTSLSKGFGIIQRFSEDLDLLILPGATVGLPKVANWASFNKGPTAQRRAFFDELQGALIVPSMRIERDKSRVDERARGADYLGHYPGTRMEGLAPTMSPFVRLEVGHARVVPQVELALSSFVHDYLEAQGMLDGYERNRPLSVRCVHPMVTLIEKLDAMSRRFERDVFEADAFVRHYEDAAQIVRSVSRLPKLEMTTSELAGDMLANKDIRALPSSGEPALRLDDVQKRAAVEKSYAEIAPMFWGERASLNEVCEIIRGWLAQQGWD